MITLVSIFLAFSVLKIFLSLLQISYLKKASQSQAVILPLDEYKKAANIAIENERFSIASSIYSSMVFIAWAGWGLGWLGAKFSGDFLGQLGFVISFIVISSLLDLPLEMYQKFIKDKKQGFSNLSLSTFALDTLKSLVLTIIFGSAFIAVLLWLIASAKELWWVFGFAFSFGVIIMINLIYPSLIAPLFNKMTPLQDPNLSQLIAQLLAKVGFKANGVFVIDASKRDNRLNAYFGGLGASKRVVLFDTLLQKLEPNEILAVLSHELGHFKNGDIYKMIAISGAMLFVMFFVFANIPSSFYAALHLSGSSGIIIFFLLFSSVFGLIFTPVVGFISRKNEFNADLFGAKLGGAKNLLSALKKLASQNKAFPTAQRFYASFYHTHPSLADRISRLKQLL